MNTGRQYLLLSLGEVQLSDDFIFVSVYIGQPLLHFLQTEHPLSLNRKPNYMYIIHYLKHRINSHLTENKNSFSPILGKKNTIIYFIVNKVTVYLMIGKQYSFNLFMEC